MKKSNLFLGIFILNLVFVSFVSSCDSSQVIFSLYSETNSHVGTYDNADYGIKACYDTFMGVVGMEDRGCSGKDVIFYKAFDENSHVSLVKDGTYTIPVCYGNLVCEDRTTTNCASGEVMIARLSSSTNAHVSLGDSDSNYPIKICCEKGSPNYISSVSSLKWIDSSSGREVSQVSNGTKVNLSFSGNFSAGEIFDYKIYVKKPVLLGSTSIEIASGSGVISQKNSFSSISFDAFWNSSYLSDGKTIYSFKIFNKDGSSLGESNELKVNNSKQSLPTQTKITSPKDREIYLPGNSIDLRWEVVSGDLPVQNITYYSSGANINGTGKESFSVSGNHDNLLNWPISLKYDNSGQKEITLTTKDSMGNLWTSRVFISVPQQGVNVFAFINQPSQNETVSVSGESNNLVRFNSSQSYVYNYSDNSFICLAGNCPQKTSGAPQKEINSSSLTSNQKSLKVQDLYFNWTWKNDRINFYGNGTSSEIIAPNKNCNYGRDTVYLDLKYGGVSSRISNEYNVVYTGDFCFNGQVASFSLSGDPVLTDSCLSEETGDCCIEGYECKDLKCVVTTENSDKTVCANFNSSREECEGKSPRKGPIANFSLGGICGNKISFSVGSAGYSTIVNCTCVWEDGKCNARYDSYVVNSQNYSGTAGSCSVSSTTKGSCNEGSIIKMISSAAWTWALGNTRQYDPNNQSGECTSLAGERTITCPVRVKLSFFGVIEFVVTIILIALIYFVFRDLFLRKKIPQEKNKKNALKKVSKKKTKKKRN